MSGTTPERTAAIGYTRVSTTEQATYGASLDVQEAAIRAECERRGWALTGVIQDAGVSGRDLRRPGIADALRRCRDGEASVLVVSKLDRLSRSILDFSGVMAMANAEGWSIVALDCAVDTTTPAGEAMANVMATFAQFERRLIGQRTREALHAKRANGVKLGRPSSIPRRVVARIRQEHADGRSLREIARRLDEDGVPTPRGGACWRPSSFEAVLRPGAADG